MGEKTIWHKAVSLSILIHLIIVPYFSWCFSKCLTVTAPKEKVIELEMVNLAKPQPRIQQAKKTVQPEKKITPPKQVEQKTPVKPTPVTKRVPTAKPSDRTPVAKTADAVTDKVASQSSGPPAKPVEQSGEGKKVEEQPASPPARQVVYVPPQLLRKVEPPYPESARESERQGTVVVRLQVLENGRVGEVSIRKSSGHDDLDQAALKAVKKWRFVPAKDKDTGQPVSCFTNFPVIFRLT